MEKIIKKENITFRIDETLKNTFSEICIQKDSTMSEELNNFIKKEVELFQKHYVEGIISELLSYSNVEIINTPTYSYSDENSCGNLVTATYIGDIFDYLNQNLNSQIKIYLKGCDIKNKTYRLIKL